MNVSESRIAIIKWEIMKILVSEIHTFFIKKKKRKIEKIRIVTSHCHLPLYHHVKINVKYEWLSLYILMIKKWDSINKSKTKYEPILIIKKWDSMNKSKNKYKWL